MQGAQKRAVRDRVWEDNAPTQTAGTARTTGARVKDNVVLAEVDAHGSKFLLLLCPLTRGSSGAVLRRRGWRRTLTSLRPGQPNGRTERTVWTAGTARSAPGDGHLRTSHHCRRRSTAAQACCYTSWALSTSLPSASLLPRPRVGHNTSTFLASFTPYCTREPCAVCSLSTS